MRIAKTAVATIALLCLNATSFAQEFPEAPAPTEEHAWLEKFVGEWESKSKAEASEDEPVVECSGVIKSRMLGGYWVVNELKTETGDMKIDALQTIGYDADKKKFVGSWIDSMSGFAWKYEGELNANRTKLSLEAEGPNFMSEGGKTTKFRDSYEFKTPNHVIATAEVLGEDGKWVTFMTGEMKRMKKRTGYTETW